MDEKWSAALNGLEAVWQRVSAQDPVCMPAPAESARRPDTAALLRGFLADESVRSAQYAAAARSARGRAAEALRALSQDCAGCYRMLRTEYYLLTGDRSALRLPQSTAGELQGSLRRAYLLEESAIRAYGEAAARAENGRVRRMFAELAERCSVRRAQVRTLVQRALGE